MIDFKKLDQADLWIASEPLTPEDEKKFSEFLKARREKQERAAASGGKRKSAPLRQSKPRARLGK